jgi:phage shock protein PspC (stress-responsive transcriptional regulator)
MADEPKTLKRSKSDRMVFGVCGGFGEYFGVDPVWFRLFFVLCAIPGGIPGILLYLICMVVIPETE